MALIAAGVAAAAGALVTQAGYPVVFFGLLLALGGAALAMARRLNGGKP